MPSDARDRLIEMISDMSDDEVQALLSKLEEDELSEEKRRHYRMPFTATVDYVGSPLEGSAMLRDLSIGGLFLEVDPSQGSFFVGQELTLSIPYPDGKKHIKIQGKVVRITRQGIGVVFDG